MLVALGGQRTNGAVGPNNAKSLACREDSADGIAYRYWRAFMVAASSVPARFRDRKCFFADSVATCSARQLRNGLLLMNCLVWLLIFYGLSFLVA